jgi:hypothetical protein
MNFFKNPIEWTRERYADAFCIQLVMLCAGWIFGAGAYISGFELVSYGLLSIALLAIVWAGITLFLLHVKEQEIKERIKAAQAKEKKKG